MTAVGNSNGDGAQDIGHNLSLLLNYLRVFVILSFPIVKPKYHTGNRETSGNSRKSFKTIVVKSFVSFIVWLL